MEIQLGGNERLGKPVRVYTTVDKEDYKVLSQYKWSLSTQGYAVGTVKGVYMLLHRFVLNLRGGKGEFVVDHMDGNKLNNRKTNLRICTVSQNIMNSKIRKNNTSGYKGVSWAKEKSKWYSYIFLNRKMYSLGYFSSPQEAAISYNHKAEELFGEFAKLNEV